ncbi:hypothetical protein D3C72_2011280 [compost metagenome]
MLSEFLNETFLRNRQQFTEIPQHSLSCYFSSQMCFEPHQVRVGIYCFKYPQQTFFGLDKIRILDSKKTVK